jgi:hypothetical protein
MFRIVLLMGAMLLASTANAQRVFRASSIDVEQNERIDSISDRVDRIETDIALIASAIEKQSEAKAAIVQAVATPSVVEKPATAKAETVVAVSQPSQATVEQQSTRYSQDELISIVKAAYPHGDYERYATVEPKNDVWRHLQSGSHGFTATQVSGLPQDIALGLHGLHHANLIRPTRGTSRVSQPVAQTQVVYSQPAYSQPVTYAPQPVVRQQPTYQAAGGCANGRCPNPAQPAQQHQRFRLFPRLGR